MEQIVVGIVIELTIMGIGIIVFRLIRKFSRKVSLIELKQDTWVEAYQIHSGNGLMESYNEILGRKMKQDEFINIQ